MVAGVAPVAHWHTAPGSDVTHNIVTGHHCCCGNNTDNTPALVTGPVCHNTTSTTIPDRCPLVLSARLKGFRTTMTKQFTFQLQVLLMEAFVSCIAPILKF